METQLIGGAIAVTQVKRGQPGTLTLLDRASGATVSTATGQIPDFSLLTGESGLEAIAPLLPLLNAGSSLDAIVILDAAPDASGRSETNRVLAVPVLYLPAWLAAVHSTPEAIESLVVVDSNGAGSIRIVCRSGTGNFSSLPPAQGDLEALVDPCGSLTTGDDVMVAFLMERLQAGTPLEEVLREAACRIAGTVCSAGKAARIDAVACSGSFFDMFRSEFRQCLEQELRTLGSAAEVLMADDDSRLLGAWRYATAALAGAGVRMSAGWKSARWTVSATRDIAYTVIHPADCVLDPADGTIYEAAAGNAVLAVVDSRIDELYGREIRAYAQARLSVSVYVLIDGSEREKNWNQVERVLEEAIRVRLPRNGLIMAIGGGVTLDVAGFAASVFRRGVKCLRIPTSLIGLVDLGVGIKQGINAGPFKNIIGTFYPASVTINDLAFLSTLPSRHLACGLAEIIKMAVVRSEPLFSLLERHAQELLECRFQGHPAANEIVLRAEQLMMQELQPNLFEQSTRRLVDFGHTFSPAIESSSGYSILHGEAVAIDMLLSARIALLRGLCSEDDLDRVARLLRIIGLPPENRVCRPEVLMEALHSARAHRAGRLNLVVPRGIGEGAFVQDVHRSELEDASEFASGRRVERASHID